MRRSPKDKIKMALLLGGALASFGIGSAHCHHRGHHGRREAFERHVAQICTDAALAARDGSQDAVDGPGESDGPPAGRHGRRHGRRHHGPGPSGGQGL